VEVYGGLVISLTGGLGAGKTALARGVAESLGARGVKSPTFATECIHRLPGKNFDLVHADLYRFDSVAPGSETDMQFQEYLSDERPPLLIVEWCDRWALPQSGRWDVAISSCSDSDERRSILMSAYGDDALAHLAAAYEAMLCSPGAERWFERC
jgi:tRNA threonylcarbamoyladenosine biosynthesis protein TsaE